MKTKYLFTSERLGFRNWEKDDLDEFASLNADKEVMKHFPNILTIKETADFIDRLQNHYKQYGHNYFAVEVINTGEFIGFIGLAYQTYETNFTPNVDIGWRLKKNAWGNGYATEGAKRCLEFAFNTLHLDNVIATCTERNYKSEHVMKKIGMKKHGSFNHPRLKKFPDYERCLCYVIAKNEWDNQ
ncbi:N-acetyltransferase [Neptunitalea chrysea]|uniref:N-acetyltransferase n=1 Tax=Neptunitalea chrysea TaxID=1647581 RepID=A0A9W6EUL6_9FLAO|nr:GNAT family N-acetyltransferase [Neptunitalea chrysea]GLB53660.1 N-acetyltransferase [Neptunitalea chrysea]